jgi:hypothetical protein
MEGTPLWGGDWRPSQGEVTWKGRQSVVVEKLVVVDDH